MKRLNLLFILTVYLFSAKQNEIPLLRWAGPEGSGPETYEEWIQRNPPTEFSWILDKIAYGDGRAGNVAILTEQNIARPLRDNVDQLISNLLSEGYTILSYKISGGTPELLRARLQTLYNVFNIEGALFIGNLPIAWYEIADDFNQYDYADFPIDLFYMDLDGTWLDTMNTGNGKYDGHTGNLHPDIYVGRLLPNGLGDDTLLLQNYFRKDNAFRHDTLFLTQRALVFVDDDWEYWGPEWAQDVSLLYPDTLNYWDPETTRASVYRVKLDTTHAWVSVFAHSWPGGHSFAFNNGFNHDYYYSHEYTNQDPLTNFYNFFACSFSRYTTAGNCGGNRAIFNQTSGIGSIGSTKTGSMLDFNYFYLPLGQDKTLGEAFKHWFTCIYDSVGMTFNRLCWHYGMTLLADPFLKPCGHQTSIAEIESNAHRAAKLTLLGNPASRNIYLKFSLDTRQDVQLSLYDCAGRQVNRITNQSIESGNHTIKWQLTDHAGRPLPKGVYILRAEIDKEIITLKIIKT